MDFCYDARDGEYKLLDVNPRIGSTFRLFVSENGMDVVRAAYFDLTGQRVTPAFVPDGRKWIVEDFDLVAALRYYRDRRLTLTEWFKSLSGIHESAFVALDDPLPALLMLRTDAMELSRRINPGRGVRLLEEEDYPNVFTRRSDKPVFASDGLPVRKPRSATEANRSVT